MRPEQPVETTGGAGAAGFSRDMGRAVDAPVASGNGFSMRTLLLAAGFANSFVGAGGRRFNGGWWSGSRWG
jgi:hypothetical protein